MGEKIRDVHLIHLARKELMVELNEGYTKEQGRVIHIQNSLFRYLMTEKEFLKAASLILRGVTELKYIKEKPSLNGYYEKVKLNDADTVRGSLFSLFDDASISYRVLDANGRVVTILVDPQKKNEFHHLIKSKHIKALWHPQGSYYGYSFLYQMDPFEIYKLENIYYEIMFQLPCMSLTEKTWIPLDKKIQGVLWNDCSEQNGIKYATLEVRYIYYLARCVFYYKKFSQKYIDFFDSNSEVANNTSLIDNLRLVFFHYTDNLIIQIRKKEYERIIEDYYSFNKY